MTLQPVKVPIGANMGSTLKSFSFITKKNAYAESSLPDLHDVINLLNAPLLFPVEEYFSLLTRAAQKPAALYTSSSETSSSAYFINSLVLHTAEVAIALAFIHVFFRTVGALIFLPICCSETGPYEDRRIRGFFGKKSPCGVSIHPAHLFIILFLLIYSTCTSSRSHERLP
jgi:hypothetical protein